MRKIIILVVLILQGGLPALWAAQAVRVADTTAVSLSQFMEQVAKGNLRYIAEKLNIPVAEAQLKASRIFPDPELSFSYSNNQNQTLHMGESMGVGISYPVSLGNKRGAGVGLAMSQLELSELMLAEYFKNLRADAALSFYTALKQQESYKLQQDTYRELQTLAKADSLRHKLGEATELDAMQTDLEAKTQLNEVYQSEADLQNVLIDMSRLQGRLSSDTLLVPQGRFPVESRVFDLGTLIERAIEEKEAVKIAEKNREISERNLRVIKAGRAFEFSMEAGYSQTGRVTNETAPAPAFHTYSAGISIPLKFSNLNRGSLNAGKLAIRQSELQCRDVRQQIAVEVTQAYNRLTAMQKQLSHFNSGLVEDAQKVLSGRLYAYQRGESALVDVINARHSYNDLRSSYLDAILGYTAALIDLERAAGIWDIDSYAGR